MTKYTIPGTRISATLDQIARISTILEIAYGACDPQTIIEVAKIIVDETPRGNRPDWSVVNIQKTLSAMSVLV